MGLFDRRIRLGQRRGDGGYAMVSVVGFGAAMVIGVGAVGAYALQNMNSAGRSQGFGAAIQAAQAGVDDFVAQLSVDPDYAESPVTDWQPVVGSEDGAGRACVGTDATLPPNCPRFRHSAAATPTGYIVTSVGKARGLERAVQVRVKARALTDYLYFSEVEAADPADGWAYPPLLGGAPVGCENPAWGSDPRPPAGCVVPPWRGGDATDGSRVHTDDVFTVAGAPSFNSRVTAAIEACRTDVAACVDEAGGAAPAYHDGPPAYADDLTMPANGLTTIAAHAASGGCTYYGPTRISFEGEQMRVWSPQTPPSASCGGGIDADVLNAPVDVVVTAATRRACAPRWAR